MNLFDRKGESSEASFEDTKLKENTNQLPLAPIQNEDGVLTFAINGIIYSLNVNLEEERKRVKKEINTNSLAKYDWFKEETGEEHWVIYNTKMYEVIHICFVGSFLHYRESSALAPIIPINATSCFKMFEACRNLTTLDLSRFNTKNVVDMGSMFFECENLMSLNVSNFNTSKVNDMGYMFNGCKALTQLDFSSFDTSKVIYMDSMFRGCESLTQLDLSGFITSKVTDMSYMFYRCSNLMQLDLSSFNTGKVIYMWRMFYKCKTLIQLDLSNFDTSKVFNMCSMFKECKALTTIYISDKWNIDSVKYSGYMFNDCYSLQNFSPEKTDIEMAKLIEEGGYLTLKK